MEATWIPCELSGMAILRGPHCCWVSFMGKIGELAVLVCLSLKFKLYATESTKTDFKAYR